MIPFRIALANLLYPSSPAASVALAEEAIVQAGAAGAGMVCFPECFVPGYRWPGKAVPPHDPEFLDRAWADVSAAARRARVGVILGTERQVGGALRITAMVVDADGALLGWQDKVELDPSEEGIFSPGTERRVFQVGPLTFGVAIWHEGWRYPETVR
jgi:predicted amidohydrolase